MEDNPLHAMGHPLKYTAFEGMYCRIEGYLEASAVQPSVPGIFDSVGLSSQRFPGRMFLWTTSCIIIIMTDLSDEGTESQFVNPFLGSILEPGSSFNPTFLLILHGVFLSLFLILATFAVLTSGNIHLICLTFIELALWISVKWYVKPRVNPGR